MIEKWVEEFKKAWLDRDIRAVLNLFTEDVEYWETPFQKIAVMDLPNAWNAILTQKNIKLVIEPLMSDGERHVVRWKLTYDRGNDTSQWAGVYILRLNDDGRCKYFYQVGEKYE